MLAVLIVSVFAGPAAALSAQDDPSGEVPLVEKPWDQLSNKEVTPNGEKALAIAPKKWRHAETENFILHYRRVTEARKVAREIEYDIRFIAKTLGATPQQYKKRSHVFVFEDETEWNVFLGQTDIPSWTGSFALGDELFLNVRRSGETGRFDSQTLAHETTHAVVARLYPDKRWPLWLSEGFAEYMGSASVAARKNEMLKLRQHTLNFAQMPIDDLMAMNRYPEDAVAVERLYQTSEKLVRFIMDDLPRDRFLHFIDAILDGSPFKTALLMVYSSQIASYEDFERRYEKVTR